MKYYALLLCGICFVVFFLQLLFPSLTDSLLLDQGKSGEVWRFVTAIFVHGGLGHLLMNMFALALFGSILESVIESKKFLLVFFSAGILANIVAVFFYTKSLGASGAIFGVLGTLILLRPGMMVFAFGLPMPLFIAGILWAASDFLGLIIPSDVGNIAHLTGLAVGLLFGIFLRPLYSLSSQGSKIRFHEPSMRKWEDDYLR